MSDSPQKLKSLQTFLKEALDKLYTKRDELRLAQREERFAADQVTKLQNEIRYLENNSEILFTEHAMLRFFERVLGYDLEKVKEEMLPAEFRERLRGKPYHEFRVGDSHMLVLKHGKVITVLPLDAPAPKVRIIKETDGEDMPSALDDFLVSDGDAVKVEITDEHSEGGGGTAL